MGMLGLEQVQLFWERSLDTKVLIGWSPDTIVISVRGTASLRNAMADIQVPSPPPHSAVGSLKASMTWQPLFSGVLHCPGIGLKYHQASPDLRHMMPSIHAVAAAGVAGGASSQAGAVVDGIAAPGAPRLLHDLGCQWP